jgi:hypothetical protein
LSQAIEQGKFKPSTAQKKHEERRIKIKDKKIAITKPNSVYLKN